jgi:hypothetical protein
VAGRTPDSARAFSLVWVYVASSSVPRWAPRRGRSTQPCASPSQLDSCLLSVRRTASPIDDSSCSRARFGPLLRMRHDRPICSGRTRGLDGVSRPRAAAPPLFAPGFRKQQPYHSVPPWSPRRPRPLATARLAVSAVVVDRTAPGALR